MKRAEGLAAEIIRASEKYRMMVRGDRVLCALSGGADSTALTILLSRLADELGIKVFAAHLNHGLRGEASDSDERFVRELCESHNIPLETRRENVGEIAKAGGKGIEETARDVRYRFLRQTADRLGCTKIATAHTANDNAETILMNMVRGTGLRGLCGIPPVRGNIVRPLLFSERKSIESYLSDQGIGYVTDESNFDTSYTRNKIRHQVIPLLLEINPSFTGSIREMAELLRGDADCLDDWAEELFSFERISPSILIEDLKSIPDNLSGRVIRRMYSVARGNSAQVPFGLSKEHVDSVLRLAYGARPCGEIHLPGGVIARRSYAKLEMVTGRREGIAEEKMLELGQTSFGGWLIIAELINDNSMRDGKAIYLDPSLLRNGIYVRGSKAGDTISPSGRNWTKTLKKLYIEMKIPRNERPGRPVITCGGSVCAIPGFAADKKFAANEPPALKISFMNDEGLR